LCLSFLCLVLLNIKADILWTFEKSIPVPINDLQCSSSNCLLFINFIQSNIVGYSHCPLCISRWPSGIWCKQECSEETSCGWRAGRTMGVCFPGRCLPCADGSD
jgi:hypothetical protein